MPVTPVDPPQTPETKPAPLCTRYVDLSLLNIATPPGWSNEPDDLSLDYYFVPGEHVHAVLEHHGFHSIRAVLTDFGDMYIIQAERNGKRNYFEWNYLADRLRMLLDDLEIGEVVGMVGRPMALARAVYVVYPDE